MWLQVMGLLHGGLSIVNHERGVELAKLEDTPEEDSPVLGLCWLKCSSSATAPSRFVSGSGNGCVRLVQYTPETGTGFSPLFF